MQTTGDQDTRDLCRTVILSSQMSRHNHELDGPRLSSAELVAAGVRADLLKSLALARARDIVE